MKLDLLLPMISAHQVVATRISMAGVLVARIIAVSPFPVIFIEVGRSSRQ